MTSLDKIDQKIMKELDLNPKIPLTKLAKKVRTSQQVADYRIKRLIKNQHIIKFGTIINLKALRQEHYRIFFTFSSHKKYSNDEIFAYLKSKKGVYWAARIGGRFDLHVTLFVFDFEELDQFIEDFNNKFPGLIKDYKASYGLEHQIYRHKYYGINPETIKYGYNDEPKKIDKIDKKILYKIKDNCRLSALEISEDLNVSYKTVINRIKALEKNKVILGYRLFIKSEDKKPRILLIFFKNYSKDEENKLLSYLESHKNISQSVKLFGIWNLFVHVRIENIEKLQDVIIDLRNNFEIINNIDIVPVFEDITINLMPV